MLNKKSLILALVACTLWASAFPTLKMMYIVTEVGSGYGIKMLLAGIRFMIAGAIILIYYTVRYRKLPLLKGGSWLKVLFLGMIQTGIMYMFYYIGIYNISGFKASILSQMSIFLVVIMSHFLYHDDRLHIGKGVGLAVGFLGIVVVNFNELGDSRLFDFSLFGEGFMIISGIFSAVSTFYAKKISKEINPILLNGWQIFLGGFMLLVPGLITSGEPLDFSDPSAVPLLIYSSLISSGAFTLWYMLLQKNKASQLAMIRFSIPVLGIILSAIFLPGEELTVYVLLSLVLVSMGIVLCNRPELLLPKSLAKPKRKIDPAE